MATTNITLGFPSGVKVFEETDLEGTVIAVSAAAVTLYAIELDNSANAAQDNYVKLWNVAAGSVTIGTTAPDWIIEMRQGAKTTIHIPGGSTAFSAALSCACVTAGGTAGTTNPGSGVVVRIIYA